MPHEQRREANQLGNEEDESKNDHTKGRMTKNFADNVTVQYAHVAKGECNTREELRQEQCRR